MTSLVTTRCARCDAEVIAVARPGDAADGEPLLLDAAPHPLGLFRTDGRPWRKQDFDRFWSPNRPAGRRAHVCNRPAVALCAADTAQPATSRGAAA
jgi:hypothetical protein